jgi:hypothetical protein
MYRLTSAPQRNAADFFQRINIGSYIHIDIKVSVRGFLSIIICSFSGFVIPLFLVQEQPIFISIPFNSWFWSSL